MQAELVIADSVEELHYLASQLHSSDQLNSTAFYWIGQVGRFQLSVVHSASDPVHHCPVLRTGSLLGNTSLEPCQLSKFPVLYLLLSMLVVVPMLDKFMEWDM